jgi:hypothetical protein
LEKCIFWSSYCALGFQGKGQLQAAPGFAAHSEAARRLLHDGAGAAADMTWGSLPKKVQAHLASQPPSGLPLAT